MALLNRGKQPVNQRTAKALAQNRKGKKRVAKAIKFSSRKGRKI